MDLEGRFAYQSFRPGQRELARRVYDACLDGETLAAEAMSGFGKTAAVLSGALTAAEETACRVVYACRTKRQINRVMEEIARLQSKHPFKAASMLSKFDYCLLRRHKPVPQESFGWYCTFNVSNNLCSYFLNVTLSNDFTHLVDGTLSKVLLHHELMEKAEDAHVCPYEVARLAMVQATISVVPYSYVFDPRAIPILFDHNSLERTKTILVMDEAHNLRDFFRGLNSSSLSLSQVDGAIREAEVMLMEDAANSLTVLKRTLEQVLLERVGWKLDRRAVLERFRQENGTAWLQNLAFVLSASSGAAWSSIVYGRKLPSLILHVGEFLSRLSSESRAVLVKWETNLGLVDPDPVTGVSDNLSRFRASILLSATVNPTTTFARSVGLQPHSTKFYQSLDEPLVKVRTAVDTGTSTRYKLRTPEMYSKISERIASIIDSTPTGVGVFAPSYAVLAAVFEMVSKRVKGRNMVSEARGLSNEQATDLFESFMSADDSVLFGVQGGRFSEGEDFHGGAMGSIVVVGLAMPPPSPMIYAEYYSLKRSGDGDSYLILSRLPALRKAFQAAGRHVRSPGKRGLVFFLDERFGSPTAMELMPTWLRKDLAMGDFTPTLIESFSRDFWADYG